VSLEGATFVATTTPGEALLAATQGDDTGLEDLRRQVAGLLAEGLCGGALREAVQEACRLGQPAPTAAEAGAWSDSEEDEALGRAAAPTEGDEEASSEEDAAIHRAVGALVRRREPRTVVLGGERVAAPANQPRWLAAWQARRAAREAEDAVHREMAEVYRAGAQGQFRRWV